MCDHKKDDSQKEGDNPEKKNLDKNFIAMVIMNNDDMFDFEQGRGFG